MKYIKEFTFTSTKEITAWQLWQYLAWRDQFRRDYKKHYSKLKFYQFNDPFYAFKLTIDDIPESIREFLDFEYFEIPYLPKSIPWYKKII